MHFRWLKYDLKFKVPFAIAHGTRTQTEVLFVEIKHNNLTGYGEAAFPPYLPENRNSAIEFYEKIISSAFNSITTIEDALNFIHAASTENHAAKAALDMALMDLHGKQLISPLYKLWNSSGLKTPPSTFTIGMGTPKEIIEKVKSAAAFDLLKVKLGGPFDKLIIETIHSVTDQKICVDANQGWYDEYFAVDMIEWLSEMNCVFVEQPLPKDDYKKMEYVFERSVLPVIADESLQTINDLEKLQSCFHGINVKLMKCGGLSKAKELCEQAKAANMKILLGCMSESSCGCSAASQLFYISDWLDLDGPLLINNDPFTGIKFENGKLMLPEGNGTGAEPDETLFT